MVSSVTNLQLQSTVQLYIRLPYKLHISPTKNGNFSTGIVSLHFAQLLTVQLQNLLLWIIILQLY